MIEHREGNLLDHSDLTHIIHQANLYCTFGSGLASAIKRKYPEAYRADLATVRGDLTKLGSWSTAETTDKKWIINLYSQIGISHVDRTTSYDALVKGLTLLEQMLRDPGVKIGVPYRLGCGLANGSWTIVEAILTDIFASSPTCLVICRRPEDA